MKNLTLYSFLMLLALSSCKDFGDTNLDPTRSSNLDPALQLSQVQLRFSGDLGSNENLAACLTFPMVQQIGGIWLNREGQMYIYNRPRMGSLWESTYNNDILNIVDATQRLKDNPDKTNLYAICRIMKVYLFSRLTDLYGDIPYSQAAQGYNTGVVRPVYDTQESIYNDFFKELTEAAALLDASKDAVKGDLFTYNGSIDGWRKFAHSLHLRLAMRLVKRDPAKAKAEAEAAVAGGVFQSNAEMCVMKHENVQNDYSDFRGNGLSVALNQQEVLPRLCNTFINVLRNNNDPRLASIARYYIDVPYTPFERVDITDQVKPVVGYSGVNATDYVWDDWKNSFDITVPGVGSHTVTNNEQKVQLANFLIRNDAPFLHLTYAEVEFLLAEANIRFGLNLGGINAKAHYEKGIEAALSQLSLFTGGPVFSDNEVAAFKASVQLIPGREIEGINTQLWIALFLNSPEAYANWRRTGYPVLTPALNTESNTSTIPRRLEYPLSEQEQNATNYQTAVQALGGQDTWTARVWWDKE
ncbi:Starch-binding associating with outer membrane [bacterium A37T11]|nr:Starch-binding associating with outer membrane [bacterium A37T11]